MSFGEKLSFLRKQRGMTQLELAEKLDVSRQAVSKWERGTAEPSTENLISIGKLFDISVDVLVNESLQLQDELTTQTATVEHDSDSGLDHDRAARLVGRVISVCLVMVIIAMITIFCCGRLINQETKGAVSIDKLEKTKLDGTSSSFHMEVNENE